MNAQWTPREFNAEADALTNDDFSGFSMDRRIKVDVAELEWIHLTKMETLAKEFYSSIQDMKRARGGEAVPAPRKVPRGERLRDREPW